MKKTFSFTAINTGVSIHIENNQMLKECLKILPGKLCVKLSPVIRQRTSPENRYYWGVVVSILSDYTGFTPDEIHEILKRKFLRQLKFVQTKNGFEEVEIPRSTTELTTSEMEVFLRSIREWSSIELGCYIPLPNEELSNV